MAKRLNYQIGFSAETKSLEASLNKIFESLNKLGTTPKMVASLHEASTAALELRKNLEGAINQSTGKLDLRAFNDSLQRSGRTLKDYRDQLIKLGPAGQEAFLNVAQAITRAELPLRRSNKLLSELWITMKNTMRWQLTSSVLHGFVGSIQTAYGYAKDLDESLNSIRIVTSKSAEDMADFAKQANNAAKALSSTTTDYTNASLIYYQQGLSDEEVEGRTNTTIKLANVARESAEEASEQLTAIWNNFYDGSKSLEYYTDVMVALGASTASSSQEIAQGIQKFAAVADTVGLSYEYAASALATITATTRQSADVVGTALKTLFARIQDLELGETLEDGTTFGSYSQALEKVGINIKDVNGNLKEMDDILDEMGSKWDTISKDSQIALAQQVAGVRQYTQLIALLDNWDFFKANLDTANMSEGALDQQAKVYAESWEAARDRVRASAEDIYNSLISPDFYIGVDNVLTPILTTTAKVIDGLGGMQSVLAAVAILMNKVYGDRIAQSMRDMVVSLGFMTSKEQERVRLFQQEAAELTRALAIEQMGVEGPEREKINLKIREVELQGTINGYADQLNEKQRALLQTDLDRVKALQSQTEEYASQIAKSEQSAQINRTKIQEMVTSNVNNKGQIGSYIGSKKGGSTDADYKKQADSILALVSNSKTAEQAVSRLLTRLESVSATRIKLRSVSDEFERLTRNVDGLTPEIREAVIALEGLNPNTSDEKIIEHFEKLKQKLMETDNQSKILKSTLQHFLPEGQQKIVEQFVNNLQRGVAAEKAFEVSSRQAGQAIDEVGNKIANNSYKIQDWADRLVQAGTNLSTLTMGMNAIRSFGNLFDENLSGTDRFIQGIMSLSMMLYTVNSLMKQYKIVAEQGGIAAQFAGIKNTYLTATEVAVEAGARGASVALAGFGAVANAVLGPLMIILSIASLVITAIMQIAQAISNSNKQRIEQAKEAHEATQQEIDDNNALIDSYNELLSTYKETGQGKEDLANKALEVAEALGLESAAIANLTGDYSNLNQEITKAQAELNSQALQDNINSSEIYGNEFVDAMRKGTGRQTITGKYTMDLGTNYSLNSAQSEALKNTEFYNQYGKSTALSSEVDGQSVQYGESFSFTAANADAETLIKMYEAAQEAAEEMRKAQLDSGEVASETYNNLTAWLNKSTESYKAYKDILIQIESGSFQEAVNSVDKGNIGSYEEYLNYYKQLNIEIQKRVDSGEIEAENVEKLTLTYLAGEEELRKYAIQQQLVNDLTDKFGTDISKISGVNEALEKLSEQDLQMAISLVPEVSNSEEFTAKFEQLLLQSLGSAAQESMDIMAELVQELNKNNHISDDDYDIIRSDSGFMEQIEAEFEDFNNFLKLTEQQQIEYIRDYYTAVQTYAVENLDEQKKNAQVEYDIAFSKYEALRQLQEKQVNGESDSLTKMANLRAEYARISVSGTEEEINEILNQWEELQKNIADETGIDIRFDVDDTLESMDGLSNQLDEISEKIKDLTSQQIKIAIDWSDFDDIKSQFDSLADFASIMKDASKKIGDSYQYPIDEIREWMEIYPELFAKAQVNTNGLISLTQAEVDAFIQGKKDETNANAESKIAQWEIQKQDLEVTRDALLAEQEAFRLSEQGKIDYSKLSSEQRASLVQQLTEYQIERGVDTTTAQKNALETMGLNEEEYSRIVAEVSQKNAENTINSTAEGAEKGGENLSKFSSMWKALGHNIGEIAKKIKAAFSGDDYEMQFQEVFSFAKSSSGFKPAQVNANFKGHEVNTTDLIEDFKAEQLKQLDLDLSAIDNAISSIDAKILAARNLQNAPPEQGSGNSSSGGGSSNKDGKTYDPEDKKTLEDIEDRYHEINREIEDQNSLLEDIGNNIDRAYGTDRLKEYEKELGQLTEQQNNYNDKLLEAQNYLNADKDTLLQLFGNEISFKENGEINDYNSMLQKTIEAYNNNFLADYNAFLATFSALTKDEQEARQAEYDSWENQKQIAEALYQKRLDALKQYEDTLDVVQEINDSLEDVAREIADNRLNQIEHRLDVVITVKNMRDAVRELTKEIAESFGDALTHGIQAAEINWESAQDNMKMLGEYQKTFADYQNELNNATNQTDIDRIVGNLEDLQGQAISTAQALLSWIESIEVLLPDAIDAASNRFELFTNQLEHNTSILETIEELYALQGVTYKTTQGFNQLQRVSQERLEAQVAQAQLQRTWFENAQSALLQAEEALVGVSETDAAYDTLKNNRDALLAEFNEAQQAMLTSAQEAMQSAQDMYLRAIEKAAYDFGQAVSGGTGLDLLQQKYDHYIETEERYLDKVNEAYQVSSWYNKLQVDIDKTSNSTMKNRLKDLQDEINLRRQGGKLSQYDLDILEAKYKVLQAQMELEDAQNNKNQLRLVRDRQGNWNYQYTADQGAIEDAEQNLLGAENDWYNIAKEQVNNVTGEIISTWQECQNQIKEIYSDMTLTDEERAAKAEEIYNYYTEKIKYLEEEKQNAIADMTEAGNKSMLDMAIIMGDEVSDLTGITSEEIQKIIADSGMSIIDLLTADNNTIKDIVGSNTELIDLFDNVFAKDLSNMTSNTINFESELQKTLDKANADFEKYQDTVGSVADETGTSLDDLRDFIDQVSDSTDTCRDAGLEAADAMWEELNAVQDLSEGYADLADSVYEYIRALKELAANMSSSVSNASGMGPGKKYDPNTDYSAIIEYGIANGLMSYGDSLYNDLFNQRENKIDDMGLDSDYYKHRGDSAEDWFSSISKGDSLSQYTQGQYESIDEWLERIKKLGASFDTGGYTGDFSNSKLAFLHEKELILNQDDTKNILSAVNSVRNLNADVFRQIEKMLDGETFAAIGLLASKIGEVSMTDSSGGTIEQKITIEHVEFPNVQSSDEIKDAFASLANDAVQWARRRKD